MIKKNQKTENSTSSSTNKKKQKTNKQKKETFSNSLGIFINVYTFSRFSVYLSSSSSIYFPLEISAIMYFINDSSEMKSWVINSNKTTLAWEIWQYFHFLSCYTLEGPPAFYQLQKGQDQLSQHYPLQAMLCHCMSYQTNKHPKFEWRAKGEVQIVLFYWSNPIKDSVSTILLLTVASSILSLFY